MNKYETIIRITQQGLNETETEERAGILFDSKKMEMHTMLSHEKTHLLSISIEDKMVIKKYEMVIRVLNEARDEFEAGEKAGYLIDIEKMFPNTTISCDPTRIIARKEPAFRDYKSIAS